MTQDEVLGKIVNHEMIKKEAQHIKKLSMAVLVNNNIALKANKKSKGK